MMSYSLYELERGIERDRLGRSDAAAGRFAEALSNLGRFAVRAMQRLGGRRTLSRA